MELYRPISHMYTDKWTGNLVDQEKKHPGMLEQSVRSKRGHSLDLTALNLYYDFIYPFKVFAIKLLSTDG